MILIKMMMVVEDWLDSDKDDLMTIVINITLGNVVLVEIFCGGNDFITQSAIADFSYNSHLSLLLCDNLSVKVFVCVTFIHCIYNAS